MQINEITISHFDILDNQDQIFCQQQKIKEVIEGIRPCFQGL